MIYDITRPLYEGMPVWPGDPEVRLDPLSSVSAGEAFTLSRLTLGTHTGTHLDAPRHVLAEGKGVDELPLGALIGHAAVIDISPCAPALGVTCLARKVPKGCERLLLKGPGGLPPFWLTEEAARWLAQQGMLLVGTDQPSLDPLELGVGPAHRILLSAGIILVENLALESVSPGEYDLFCLPLKLCGGDGAPVRAVLLPPQVGRWGA